MDRIKNEEQKEVVLKDLFHQAELMAKLSLCPLGQSPILPINSSIKYFESELLNIQPYN
jgi:NADH:ubiquinone oxidoreductase subunit F (NADH-binding)